MGLCSSQPTVLKELADVTETNICLLQKRSLITGRIWNYTHLLKARRRTWNCGLDSFFSVPGCIKNHILLESIPKCIKGTVRISVQHTKGKSCLTKWLPSSVQWRAISTRGWWCFLTERILTLFPTILSFGKWTCGQMWIVNCLDIWAKSMLNSSWTSNLQLDESSPAISNEVHIVHHLHQWPGWWQRVYRQKIQKSCYIREWLTQ